MSSSNTPHPEAPEAAPKPLLSYRVKVGAQPAYAPAQINRAASYHASSRKPEALTDTQLQAQLTRMLPEQKAQALQLLVDLSYYYPDVALYWNALGAFERLRGNAQGAFSALHKALALQENNANVHYNLALTHHVTGGVTKARTHYERAIALAPQFAAAHNNYGTLLSTNLGAMQAASDCFERAMQADPALPDSYTNYLLASHFLDAEDAVKKQRAALHFGELVQAQAQVCKEWKTLPVANKRLRIGLVSADFRNHAAGYFLLGVLQALCKTHADEFAFYAYSNSEHQDELSRAMQACCAQWLVVHEIQDGPLARRIFDDEIDILIDLNGHTGGNRLAMFAWKPAPVQASWLGYFNTTGVKAIDYLIADSYSLPPELDALYTERIWRLPETRLCFTPSSTAPELAPLPALQNGYITWGSFNQLAKLNDTVLRTWLAILQARPNSRLLIKSWQLPDADSQEAFRQRLRALGFDTERVTLTGPVSRDAYLSSFNDVDILLDSFPYPGGATTAEALWMGVPVLSLKGKSFLSRQGYSLLRAAGLEDWVATSTEEYIAFAQARSQNIAELAALRSKLREQVRASPLFDSERFASHFAQALRAMWVERCTPKAPVRAQTSVTLGNLMQRAGVQVQPKRGGDKKSKRK